ncbi:unnamed protein product [Staurois parvus]|uniref:Uncharacterized protein n=1 Tax=Staurois parvus TaxID=386267 RepID=A0ABN9EKL7_9NEOB|nr:unnamed protein product [Staurois parvus]
MSEYRAARLFSAAEPYLFLGPALYSPLAPASLLGAHFSCLCHFSCTMSAVSSHRLYCVCSLWSSPVLSAVSGHLLYCVRSLWSSPVLCPQSLVISCTVSAVSGHLLYYVRSL